MADKEIVLSNGDSVIIPDRRNDTLNLNDLYKYRLVDSSSEIVRGNGSYVAKVDDMIYSFAIGWMRCARVDLSDYSVDLVSWNPPNNHEDVSDVDELLGIGPGSTSESYRVYIDTRVFPHRLDINSRLRAYSETAKEVRVFKGYDDSETGTNIAANYDPATMEYLGDAIPMRLVGTREIDNVGIMAPAAGFTTYELKNGAPVTVVVYGQSGQPIDVCRMLVHNTNVIRHPEDYAKRVKSVEIVSPYLSLTEPNTLEVRINATVATLSLRAKITYTNGLTSMQDVVEETANGKVKLIGLKYWSPQIPGDEQQLELMYALSEGEEYSYLQGETANGMVRVPYKIRALPADPAFTLKLFTFPVWKNSVQGYVLEHWICDLARQVTRRAPAAAVSLVDGYGAFDGLDYITNQRLRFGVDLSVVDPSYDGFTFAQIVQISLLRDGGIAGLSNWKVKFSGNQADWYGDALQASVHATTGGLSTINVGNNLGDKATWLQKLFWNAAPLYDIQTEPKAPEPTHFIVVTKTREFEFPVSQWNQNLTFVNDLTEGQTVYLKWIKRMVNADLQLGVSGLPLHAV